MILTLQNPIGAEWLQNLQRVPLNKEIVAKLGSWIVNNVVPRACPILVRHPMIIEAFFVVIVIGNTPVPFKINWRLPVLTTVVSGCGT